jgi:hypothetical protein
MSTSMHLEPLPLSLSLGGGLVAFFGKSHGETRRGPTVPSMPLRSGVDDASGSEFNRESWLDLAPPRGRHRAQGTDGNFTLPRGPLKLPIAKL